MNSGKAVIEALAQAGISELESCGCCLAGPVGMARSARDLIRKQRKEIAKLKSLLCEDEQK